MVTTCSTIEHDERALAPADWFACDWPERPYEAEHTVFLSECYPCRLALRAAALNGYAGAHVKELPTGELVSLVTLSAAWGTL